MKNRVKIIGNYSNLEIYNSADGVCQKFSPENLLYRTPNRRCWRLTIRSWSNWRLSERLSWGRKRSYIVDIYTKWHRNYFYFCAKYACPGPNALSPSFDTGFARLECAGGVGRQSFFNLSYMRHTGKWWEIRHGLSLEQCLAEVREGGFFDPWTCVTPTTSRRK